MGWSGVRDGDASWLLVACDSFMIALASRLRSDLRPAMRCESRVPRSHEEAASGGMGGARTMKAGWTDVPVVHRFFSASFGFVALWTSDPGKNMFCK